MASFSPLVCSQMSRTAQRPASLIVALPASAGARFEAEQTGGPSDSSANRLSSSLDNLKQEYMQQLRRDERRHRQFRTTALPLAAQAHSATDIAQQLDTDDDAAKLFRRDPVPPTHQYHSLTQLQPRNAAALSPHQADIMVRAPQLLISIPPHTRTNPPFTASSFVHWH